MPKLATADHAPRTEARPLTGLEAAAAYLGLEADELAAWLEHGGSLGGLARTLGRSAEGAFDVVLAGTQAALDRSLPVAEIDRALADLRRRLVTGGWHAGGCRTPIAA